MISSTPKALQGALLTFGVIVWSLCRPDTSLGFRGDSRERGGPHLTVYLEVYPIGREIMKQRALPRRGR